MDFWDPWLEITILFTSTIELRSEQINTVDLAMAVEQGVIVAQPGSENHCHRPAGRSDKKLSWR